MAEIELGERRPLGDVHADVQALHDELVPIVGCEGRHDWRTCPAFTLTRARGIGHTMFIVQRPDFEFTIIDWSDEGPVAALHAQTTQPVEHYSDAIEYVSKSIAFEDAENRGEPMTLKARRN